jgi:hypothetical protein
MIEIDTIYVNYRRANALLPMVTSQYPLEIMAAMRRADIAVWRDGDGGSVLDQTQRTSMP